MLGGKHQRLALLDGLRSRECGQAINLIRLHARGIKNKRRLDQLTVAIQQDRDLYDQGISAGNSGCCPTSGQLIGYEAGYLPTNARLSLLWNNWPASE